jgi:hypothetical protein
MSLFGALVKTGKGARKAEPFYSAVDEAAAALTRGKGTGKEFMTEVLKTKGVKPTEVKERNLRRIEEMPKMTKEEFLAELEKSPAPQIKETVFGELDDKARLKEYQRIAEEEYGRSYGELDHDEQMDVENLVDYDNAQYAEHKLEGGQNYREILLKLPAMSDKDTERLMYLEAKYRRMSQPSKWVFEDSPEGKEMKALNEKSKKSVYYSPHWGSEEPNVLAHIRVQDRVMPTYTKQQAEEIGQRIAEGMGVADPKNLGNGAISVAIKNGYVTPKEAAQYADFRGFQGVDTTGARQKVLHVEEIQSDWHQAGRKKGYKTPEVEARRKELEELAAPYMDGSRPMPPELRREIEALPPMTAVPDAPFKKNWHELAMKRVLNYAAQNGYDRVAITPGATQADRYSLAKHVDQVEVYKLPDGTYNLEVIDTNGKSVTIPDSRAVSAERISDIIGKEVAEKAIAQADEAGQSVLGGLDLQVGGEGMKGFYDKMLPDYLNSYGKKYGVQVQMEGLPAKIGEDLNFPEAVSRANNLPAHVPGESVNLHSFDITPEMRQEITGKGMPLYQQIGIPTGGAAAGMGALEGEEDLGFKKGGQIKKRGRVNVSQNPDTMLLDLLSRN